MIFDRLVGLETEYAMRFHPTDSFAPTPSKFQLYLSLISALRDRVLTARAKHFKEGVFTANGGAVWFETERIASDGGLVEGATPECRGPRQVQVYQRAQDRLLSQAAQSVRMDGEMRLIKNCRDSRDNVYGAQENYEATLATGWRLFVWRVGLILLLPLVLFTWVCLLMMIIGVLIYLVLAGLIYLMLRLVVRQHRRVGVLLFGRDLVESRETGAPLPAWLEWLMLWVARIVSAPLALALLVLARATAFREIRRRLLPLLVSRAVLAGSGMIDRKGKFHLADKAPAVNCVIGFGGYLWDRPIFNFGHFFKAISLESLLAPGDYWGLLRPRQRLQIGLGDSNMAETAEFLRVGTTLLVLDAIEAGLLKDAPRLWRPIRAMHRMCADPSLSVEVATAGGRRMTALELQRYYLNGCRQFVEQQADAPSEAHEVLRLWTDALDRLEAAPKTLVGTLDWVTKKFLLEGAGSNLGWAERKKIDIRYHELSNEGYYNVLAQTDVTTTLVDANDVDRAVRTAPPNSPATTRGHYIREFADGEEPFAVNWKRILIGRGRGAKVVRLHRYQRSSETEDQNNLDSAKRR